MTKARQFRDIVILEGKDATGHPVCRATLSWEDYYEGLHPLIDMAKFRKQKGIRCVTGKLYEADGSIAQEFENSYDESGKFLKGRAIFADGTVQES